MLPLLPPRFRLQQSLYLKIKNAGWQSPAWGAALLLLTVFLSGCSVLLGTPVPTPMPAEYLPTAIALTMQADQAAGQQLEGALPGSDASLNPVSGDAPETLAPVGSATPQPSSTPTGTPAGPTATPYTLTPPPSPTPTPGIPNAAIEIRNLGAYSKITSPLHLYTYLKPGAGGKVRIELIGEDGRVLVRNIKTMDFLPTGAWAVISLDLDFEISATAESAWLKISVDDEFGRTVALNSVPLILLSVGEADIVPPMDVFAPIVIREPTRRTLIQGGKVLVTGMARPGSQNPLMVRLVDEKGREVGMRLAGVEIPQLGSFGPFAVEVPYKIDNPTKVLLTVTEGGSSFSDPIHISSMEVMLSP